MPRVIVGQRGTPRSVSGEEILPPRNASSTVRSREKGRNTSIRTRRSTENEEQHGHSSYLAYLKTRALKPKNSNTPSTQYLRSQGMRLKASRSLRPRQNPPETQEELDSETEGEESDDGDATSEGESEEEEEEESEEELESTTSNAAMPPGMTNSSDVLGSGASSEETLGPGSVGSSAAVSADSSASDNGSLFSNPAHLAVLVTGLVVAIVVIIFMVTCIMTKSKKRQRPGGLYSRYQDLRRRIGFGLYSTSGSESHRTIEIEKDGMTKTSQSYWNFESSFAKPYTQPGWQNPQENRSPLFRRVLTGAKSSIPHIKVRPKSLVLRSNRNPSSGLPRAVAGYEEIQPLPKAHSTDSSRSSTLLVQDQETSAPQKIPMPLAFSSKFSWTNTPLTDTKSAVYTPIVPPYPPRAYENDAATVNTEVTEPARFRTTTSWVMQQQAKNQQRTQSNPSKPKPPPSDMESFSSRNSRPPTGALPGYEF
ncbi:hypothetical protein AJ79_00984 [Helicocarpus griseus UAMH5409]|uniref:Uncharacterized protein n=1 Tax=Helicocarpus griseus UAMH5409 TaxID=1447875 RepID=A0A2B7Y9A8_9EURO|nr:hypothetical protein AJ79_00984 [Helicocarpus griseus UAMH5409]